MKNPVPFNYLKFDNIKISLRLQQFPGNPSREGCGRIFRQAILAFEEIGFVLGLFFWGLRVVHFHNPFVKKRLRSFLAFWKLGLFIRTEKSSFFL